MLRGSRLQQVEEGGDLRLPPCSEPEWGQHVCRWVLPFLPPLVGCSHCLGQWGWELSQDSPTQDAHRQAVGPGVSWFAT